MKQYEVELWNPMYNYLDCGNERYVIIPCHFLKRFIFLQYRLVYGYTTVVLGRM